MSAYTIVYSGTQEGKRSYASGGHDVIFILGKGVPQWALYPQVDAARGSEYIDCLNGKAYRRALVTGTDIDWIEAKKY